MMMEKGLNPYEGLNKGAGLKSAMFKLGIVIAGLGVGLVTIAILVEFNAMGGSDAAPIGILCISGGIGLVIANRLSNNK